MNKFFLTALIYFSFGCAAFEAASIGKIDSEFLIYTDTYNDLKKNTLGYGMRSDITILFHSLPPPVIGICYWLPDGKREIYIDPRFWFSWAVSDKDRELLIFHELGHCDLNRDHVDPSSVMESTHIGGKLFAANYLYFVSELFNESLRKQLPAAYNKIHTHDSYCGGINKEKISE